MPPTPQQQAQLAGFAARLETAGHGEGGPILREAASQFGVSRQTVYRWLTPHTCSTRKRRSDAGQTSLDRTEALQLAAARTAARRQNGREILTQTLAVPMLRASGLIKAERLDKATGEVVPLSASAISRALKGYQLHPDQLNRPSPHRPQMSEHANALWQVDASVCVIFYLPAEGLCGVMDAVHYKNKPENVKAIEKARVIRYVGTDHVSGTLRVKYYPHSESGETTVRFLAWMMARKANPADPFHGAPFRLMVDPGATSANLVKRYCGRLGIQLIVNAPGNPRAKGQVEQGNHLWERRFESRLRFADPVENFTELNRLAEMVQLSFNATAIHRRTGMPRFAKWMEIKPAELRTTASEGVLLSFASGAEATPQVKGDLTVSFMARRFCVREASLAAGLGIGAKLTVHWHPFIADTAMAIVKNAEGREVHYPLPEITANKDGFPSNAVVAGEGYAAMPDTVLDTHRKEVLKMATLGTLEATLAAAEAAARKKGYVALGGKVDPFKVERETVLPTYLPKKGTPLAASSEASAPIVLARTVSATRAAMVLREKLGDAWQPEFFEWLQKRHPDGLSEDQVERLAAQWGGDGEGDREERRAG